LEVNCPERLPASLVVLAAGDFLQTAKSVRGCRLGGVNRQAIARAINLHKSQEQRQNLSRS